MTDISPRLGLPYLQSNQAQKHVTLNSALRQLDALAQMHVQSRSIYVQPATPAPGDAYILNAARSGASWGALPEHTLVVWEDGIWQAYTPRTGWQALVIDEAAPVFFDGSSWKAVAPRSVENHLLNGAFQLWQRGTAFALPATAGTASYSADRWAVIQTAPARGLVVIRVASGLPQTPDAARLHRPLGQAAAGDVHFTQALESQASAGLAGEPVCAAIRLRCGAGFEGRTATLEIIAGRGTDQSAALLAATGWTGQQVIASVSLPAVGSGFAEHFVSGVVPSDATQLAVRLRVTAPNIAAADDWLEITSATLQAGFTPIPAPLRPASLEMLLAQRYFRVHGFASGATPLAGESTAQAFVAAISATAARLIVDLPVAMRRPPDVTFFRGAYATGADAIWNIRSGASWVNGSSTTLEVRTETQLIIEVSASVTEGLSYRINGGWTADAEL